MTTTGQVTRTDVLAIGAGFGGRGAQVYLEKWGFKQNYEVLEKGKRIGGIWDKNTYPGVACDVPPPLYSFGKFIDRSSKRFPDGESTRRYLEDLPVDPNRLHLNTRVYSLHYSDVTGEWTAKTKDVGTEGETEGTTYIAKFVILAAGQLDEPFIPDITGQELFQGAAFHTARWDHTQNLRGKKVAIIGTGPSAAQIIPAIAGVAKRVTIYQRSPNWVLPRLGAEYGPITQWAIEHFSVAAWFYRLAAYGLADFVLSPITSRGWSARLLEWIAKRQLRRQVPDPVLRKKLTPDFALGCKRYILSKDYYPALTRPNVELVTDKVEEITATGIVTDAGDLRDADVIVYATGFHTTEFYRDIDIQGRDGLSLKEDIWRNGPEAYLGVAFEAMPNLAALHGPGSFTGAGSNVVMKEHQLHLIGNMLKLVQSWKNAAIEVAPETMARYRKERDRIIRKSVLRECSSWYRDKAGRVINPFGGSMRSFRRLTRRNPIRDFQQVPLKKQPIS